LAEFTGERVIPELVDADLFNEHFARYRFAGRFVQTPGPAALILDAGCGSGYGTAELARHASGALIAGTDISTEAVGLARQRYGADALFLQAACEALPFPDAAFDLVVAFEVIEHLDRWQELLTEARRVLKRSGILLVSTPNRDYYAESRGSAGPNPFHRHEFDYEEFRTALDVVFPHVRIWTQNHAEAIVFSPESPDRACLESAGSGDFRGAHFFLAACSQSPIAANETFAWVPSSANILKERERHIAKLKGELEKKDAWLRQQISSHGELQARHEALNADLQRQNNWAAELNREVASRNVRIGELQNELETRLAWIGDLESQIEAARIEIARLNAEWAQDRQRAGAEINRLQTESGALQATVTERSLWAQRLDAEIAGYRAELERIESSKWFRAGAKLGIGPGVRDDR
jgi:ubiquinone/menaquinone biosynthesis C-methylase UbiE